MMPVGWNHLEIGAEEKKATAGPMAKAGTMAGRATLALADAHGTSRGTLKE